MHMSKIFLHAGMHANCLPKAVDYAEALATSLYLLFTGCCRDTKETAYFNAAIPNALTCYRRIHDVDLAKGCWNWPTLNHAATKWNAIIQALQVFNPTLTAKPWWNFDEFSAGRALNTLVNGKETWHAVLNELDHVNSILEGKVLGIEENQMIEIMLRDQQQNTRKLLKL